MVICLRWPSQIRKYFARDATEFPRSRTFWLWIGLKKLTLILDAYAQLAINEAARVVRQLLG
jgi:hypothetical protein